MDISIFISKITPNIGTTFCVETVSAKDSSIGFDVAELEKFAKNMRKEVENIKRNRARRVLINFYPLQNILCLSGEDPLLCEELSDEDQREFWKYFSKIADKEVHDG